MLLPRTAVARSLLARTLGDHDAARVSADTAATTPGYLAELRRWARHWTERNAPVYADPDSVVLVLTEMVTNAIRHTPGPVKVELTRDSRAIVVGVSDRSDTWPHRVVAEAETEGGRGLLLLERLATRWGVRTHPHGGKTVWCEFT